MPGTANPYASLADDHEEMPPEPKQSSGVNHFVNQVADSDQPWEKVGRRGITQKPQGKPIVLVINDASNRLLPAIVNRQNKKRAVSNPISTTSPSITSSTPPGTDQQIPPPEDYCGVCNLKFKTKASLLAHIKQNPRGHDNFCNLCRRVFKDRNGIKNHLDNSVGHDIFCNTCLSAFVNRGGLKNHFENNYAVGHNYVCLTCLKGFQSNLELERHLRNDPKHVSCTKCSLTFNNQDDRDAHWKKSTEHRHCLQPGCDKDFQKDSDLEQHLEDDHFRCEGCKQFLPSQTKLNLHFQTCKFHVPCPNCDKPVPGQIALADHLASCYRCSECDWRTDTEEKLQAHCEKHIDPKSSLPCWACAASQASLSLMIKHLEYCPAIPRTLIFSILADSYNTALYMDTDVRAQIRRGQKQNDFDLEELVKWSDQGDLHPFICRAEGTCYKVGEEPKMKFGRLSELVMHVEGEECGWNIERLRLDILEEQFARTRELNKRKDSVSTYP